MDEDELRASLRATMTMTPPPPMATAKALAAGNKAVRRRAAWAGAGLTAVLVAATSVGAAVGLHPQNTNMTAAGGPGYVEVDSNPNPLRSLLATPMPTLRDGAWTTTGVRRGTQDKKVFVREDLAPDALKRFTAAIEQARRAIDFKP